MAGYVDTWDCQACSGMHEGTVQHRTWRCKALADFRQQGIAKEIVDEAIEALRQDPEHPLYSRGLLPRSWLPNPPPIRPDEVHWYRNSDEGILSGDIYTDGSQKQRWWWRESERAGWGVVQMQGRRLRSGMYGPLPGPIQSVPRAELYAVCIALLYSVGPIRTMTDHKNIVDQKCELV